ncbi:MAG TPA: Ig-like domain-containing protein, partial [Tepidisphaeraceae bacterium]|nr:Ig-like domain-containing protein [Tepidisphaeraceae bacterium]
MTIPATSRKSGTFACAAIEALERRMLLSAASAVVHTSAMRAVVVESTTSAPSVTSSSPATGATNVQRDTSVTLSLRLPNGALDASTVNGFNIALELASNGTVVGSVVNTT